MCSLFEDTAFLLYLFSMPYVQGGNMVCPHFYVHNNPMKHLGLRDSGLVQMTLMARQFHVIKGMCDDDMFILTPPIVPAQCLK